MVDVTIDTFSEFVKEYQYSNEHLKTFLKAIQEAKFTQPLCDIYNYYIEEPDGKAWKWHLFDGKYLKVSMKPIEFQPFASEIHFNRITNEGETVSLCKFRMDKDGNITVPVPDIEKIYVKDPGPKIVPFVNMVMKKYLKAEYNIGTLSGILI